jgi:hypothetical protein
VRGTFADELQAFGRRHFADRPDGALMAAVAGSAIAGALVATFELWGEGGALDDMRAMTHRALSFVARGFDEPAPEPIDVAQTRAPAPSAVTP